MTTKQIVFVSGAIVNLSLEEAEKLTRDFLALLSIHGAEFLGSMVARPSEGGGPEVDVYRSGATSVTHGGAKEAPAAPTAVSPADVPEQGYEGLSPHAAGGDTLPAPDLITPVGREHNHAHTHTDGLRPDVIAVEHTHWHVHDLAYSKARYHETAYHSSLHINFGQGDSPTAAGAPHGHGEFTFGDDPPELDKLALISLDKEAMEWVEADLCCGQAGRNPGCCSDEGSGEQEARDAVVRAAYAAAEGDAKDGWDGNVELNLAIDAHGKAISEDDRLLSEHAKTCEACRRCVSCRKGVIHSHTEPFVESVGLPCATQERGKSSG